MCQLSSHIRSRLGQGTAAPIAYSKHIINIYKQVPSSRISWLRVPQASLCQRVRKCSPASWEKLPQGEGSRSRGMFRQSRFEWGSWKDVKLLFRYRCGGMRNPFCHSQMWMTNKQKQQAAFLSRMHVCFSLDPCCTYRHCALTSSADLTFAVTVMVCKQRRLTKKKRR